MKNIKELKKIIKNSVDSRRQVQLDLTDEFRLCDVLIALHPNILVDGLGWFWEFVDGWEYKTKQTRIRWNLQKTLDDQTLETINWLYDLLK